jgi:hypothetical protein
VVTAGSGSAYNVQNDYYYSKLSHYDPSRSSLPRSGFRQMIIAFCRVVEVDEHSNNQARQEGLSCKATLNRSTAVSNSYHSCPRHHARTVNIRQVRFSYTEMAWRGSKSYPSIARTSVSGIPPSPRTAPHLIRRFPMPPYDLLFR